MVMSPDIEVELRSDTFTLPTARMREAMAKARVGNDVYREDPTVRQLEEYAADLLAKEQACFMPSGTMANLTAILAQVPRGGALVCGNESDIYLHEAAGAAVCGGVSYTPVVTMTDGRLPLPALADAFPDDPTDPEFAPVALICLENTHNRSGGRVLPVGYLASVHDFARSREVPVHMDGARLFNAAVYLGQAAAELASYADTVQFCLSKGLCAPVGSILTGNRTTVEQVRRIRKMLGGGMRQAGILAAAGIVALTEMRDRLREDHAHARRLAEALAGCDGIEVDPATVETNIVMFRVVHERWAPEDFVAEARARGVAVAKLGHERIRAVTHAWIDAAKIDRAVAVFDEVLRAETPRLRARSEV
jgi:threonine aldolase